MLHLLTEQILLTGRSCGASYGASCTANNALHGTMSFVGIFIGIILLVGFAFSTKMGGIVIIVPLAYMTVGPLAALIIGLLIVGGQCCTK